MMREQPLRGPLTEALRAFAPHGAMFKNTTTVKTRVPVKVDFFAADLIDDPEENSLPSLAEFEVDGVIIATRRLYSEKDWDLCELVFQAPVRLCLMVGEDLEGNLSAFLTALLPVDSGFASLEDEWQTQVPGYRAEVSDASHCPFPLGVVYRPHWSRTSPRDLGTEAKSMMFDLLDAPLVEEMEAAVDQFLQSIAF